MLCLGIETSCDETALALLRDGSIVDSVLASQADLHALFGGVVPELASREHYRFIGPLFDQLLERNSFRPGDIDIIAVTRGPGLLGSLLVGSAFAKSLALVLSRPLLGINHLHAHLLAVGLEQEMVFPALGLLVSGGHTHIYRILSPKEFILMGRTLDDAAGEAFDKTGHLLGLPYPAGRHIDELAHLGKADGFNLPHPYVDNDNLDFSFSGLKTAAARIIHEELPPCPAMDKLANFCASLNSAIAETLVIKMRRALAVSPDCKSIWLAGGVAANGMIREQMAALAREAQLPFAVPSRKYCTDNAAMIAHAGYLLASCGGFHTLDLEMIPRGRKIPEDMLWH